MPDKDCSTALSRFRPANHSEPTAHAHKGVMVKGYVDRVEIALDAEIIARHRRSHFRGDVIYDPLRYLSLLQTAPIAILLR